MSMVMRNAQLNTLSDNIDRAVTRLGGVRNNLAHLGCWCDACRKMEATVESRVRRLTRVFYTVQNRIAPAMQEAA